MADRLSEALFRTAAVRRGERRLLMALRRAFRIVAKNTLARLADAGFSDANMDAESVGWPAIFDAEVAPVLRRLYRDGFTKGLTAAAPTETDYAVAFIAKVRNRLAAVPEEVFDVVRGELAAGRVAGEGYRQVETRVEKVLTRTRTPAWAGRAVTIARTETIAAMNAGNQDAARVLTGEVGAPETEVAKEWLATADSRTRETHADADGQVVLGLDTPFVVGDALLDVPGDPSGPPEEVINCRCTVLYHYPGDPAYPLALAASAATREDAPMTTMSTDSPEAEAPTATVVVALPAEGDPIYDIAGLEAHATLLFFGEVDADTAQAINDAVEAFIEADQPEPFTETATGVESLGDDDPQALVLTLSSDGLGSIREALLAKPEVEAPWSAIRQWPTFTAHITLGYPETEDDATVLGDAAAAITEVRFDRLAVWVGDTQDTYALPEEPAEPVEEPVEDEGDPAIVAAADGEVGGPWHGVLATEDAVSGDGRMLVAGATTSRVLPLPFAVQFETQVGHDTAVRAGRIDQIVRRADGRLAAAGVWDAPVNEAAVEAERQVANGVLRGVSVDMDAVTIEFVDPETREPVDLMELMDSWQPGDPEPIAAHTARVSAATACTIPAFPGAFVANGPAPDGFMDGAPLEQSEEVVDAEAVAGLVASGAAADVTWFADPGFVEGDPRLVAQPHGGFACPLTVTDDGRVFGHLAQWGTCHIGKPGCVTPPHSRTQYAYFATGTLRLPDGAQVPVGQITLGTGHGNLYSTWQAAQEHYDHTGTAVADVVAGEDDFGIWVAGMLRDDVSAADRRALQASVLSGDWRIIGGTYEMVAALAVNVGGYPIPRLQVGEVHGEQVSLVASGMLAPPATLDPHVTTRLVLAALDRRDRAGRLARRLGRDKASRAKAAAALIGRD